MSFQEHLTQMTALRQQALTQQHQQRQTIVAEWKPIVYQLLQTLGENAWGKDRYTIIEPDQSTAWTLVNFEGSKNCQFYVVLDFEPVDVDTVLAAGSSLPNQLTRAVGFRVIGGSTFNAGPSQPELERALVAALQKGPNQEPLPTEITKALSRFPYQAGEYDQRSWWKSALMWCGGPVTVLVGIGGIYASLAIAIGFMSMCDLSGYEYRPTYCDSQAAMFLQLIVPVLLLAIVSIAMLVGGIWVTRLTNFGRRYNRLPARQKTRAKIALLPGVAVTVYISLALVFGILVLVGWAGAEARKSETRQAVHDELREHGL